MLGSWALARKDHSLVQRSHIGVSAAELSVEELIDGRPWFLELTRVILLLMLPRCRQIPMQTTEVVHFRHLSPSIHIRHVLPHCSYCVDIASKFVPSHWKAVHCRKPICAGSCDCFTDNQERYVVRDEKCRPSLYSSAQPWLAEEPLISKDRSFHRFVFATPHSQRNLPWTNGNCTT